MEIALAEPGAAGASRALLGCLDGPGRVIADLLGVSGYLAVATVATRERPAGRLPMQPRHVPAVVAAARALGVHCAVGRLRMLSVPDAIPETRHAARFVKDDQSDALSLVYFGVSAAIANGAEEVELRGEHELLGRLFGYPGCCTAFYLGSGDSGADRLPAAITSLGPFDRAMNPVLPYVYGVPSMLFHFPCSPACAASLRLYWQRLRLLAAIDPGFAAVGELGAGLALYGPDVGICLATEYDQVDEASFRPHRIVSRSEVSRAFFRTRPRPLVGFETPYDFTVNSERFCDPCQFGALFV